MSNEKIDRAKDQIAEIVDELLERFAGRPMPFSLIIHPASPEDEIIYIGNVAASDAINNITILASRIAKGGTLQ